MRVIRPSALLIAVLALFLGFSSFNIATQGQGSIQYKSFGSAIAVLEFLNSQVQSGNELENVQVTADFDGVVERFNVFYREGSGRGSSNAWILSRFSSSFAGVPDEEALEDAANLTLTFLNYVGGDTSEPHLALRSAAIAAYATNTHVHFEVYHRDNDRDDPDTYGWEWFTRFGHRELSTLLQLLNGQFQENPTAFYPSDIVSYRRSTVDEHIYFNFYQVGKIGSAFNTPVGWGAQSFTNPDAVVIFLNNENPEEFRVATDHDVFEWFRVFYR